MSADLAYLYQKMFLIRLFEETLLNLFSLGHLRGTVHTCIGQEACAVGVVGALDSTQDTVCSNHSGHGVNNTTPDGIYAGDNIFTIGRNLGFLENKAFVDAWKAHAETDVEQTIVWRISVLAWVAKSVLSRKVPGDFVECACYKGTSARIICDYVDFAHSGRNYYLYDLFEHDDRMVTPLDARTWCNPVRHGKRTLFQLSKRNHHQGFCAAGA